MNVFISWSGKRSMHLAKSLRDLLPDVIQNLELWTSEHDIQAGARWPAELALRLERCDLGIACLTPENQSAPWLLFEAGALSRNLSTGRVVPLLLDLAPADVAFPMAQFQLIAADRSGITKLLADINGHADAPVDQGRLLKQIDRWWPEMQAGIDMARGAAASEATHSRSDTDLLHEILELVRDSQRDPQSLIISASIDFVWVDTRDFLKEGGDLFQFNGYTESTVSNFLDEVWKILNRYEKVPSFTYGKIWTLFNRRTGQRLEDFGREYLATNGRVRDPRHPRRFGILPGDVIEVQRPRPMNEA